MKSFGAIVVVAALAAAAAAAVVSVEAVSIEEFGAVAAAKDNAAAFQNAAAVQKAFAAVAMEKDRAARVVEVPKGKEFFIMPITLEQVYGVTLQMDGNLTSCNNMTAWPFEDNAVVKYPDDDDDLAVRSRREGRTGRFLNIISLTNCSDFVWTGEGTIDGVGFDWWVNTIKNKIPHARPHLFVMELCENVVIENIRARNSPQFHFKLDDFRNVTVRNIDIYVDVTKQQQLLGDHGLLDVMSGLPTFPLNTDGIDPRGIDGVFVNLTITNFDDAVAVKPQNGGSHYSHCSENMFVQNARVTFGVGMTIGSVPSNPKCNCVRNVTFTDVTFDHPFKAIYVKTNPGEGTGIIDQINYFNIKIFDSIWWTIYIGPQQQHQPDGTDPGCSMIYPLDPKCPTNPRVPISNITLRNVTMTKPLIGPGIVRCNATKPCTNIVFDNVNQLSGKPIWHNYICDQAQGSVTASSPSPAGPTCFTNQ
eukprot:TRINITY_DN66990_c2_g1_i1.p1 TRINITY_DN66990_c2_g1~~TRINITY_DN66990_c2_g1_i1.p1  ORF type:complete len:475 (+),score=271.71 TRINITY_DN66990_c2_g1_i1:34-1458(+)